MILVACNIFLKMINWRLILPTWQELLRGILQHLVPTWHIISSIKLSLRRRFLNPQKQATKIGSNKSWPEITFQMLVNQQFVSSTLCFFNDSETFFYFLMTPKATSVNCTDASTAVSMAITSQVTMLVVCTTLVKFLLPQGRHFMVNSRHLLFVDKLFTSANHL